MKKPIIHIKITAPQSGREGHRLTEKAIDALARAGFEVAVEEKK